MWELAPPCTYPPRTRRATPLLPPSVIANLLARRFAIFFLCPILLFAKEHYFRIESTSRHADGSNGGHNPSFAYFLSARPIISISPPLVPQSNLVCGPEHVRVPRRSGPNEGSPPALV